MASNNKRSITITNIKSDELQIKKSRIQYSKGCLDDVFDKDIRPYIDIIDSMRKYGLEQDVSLPNVVVVGDQSSGKSSIIEVISGIQLPRGTGIVTRCPLELQLKKVSKEPWKSIVSYKNKSGNDIKVTTNNPEEVEGLINKAQTEICSTKKGVSKELITLRVESSAENAPDLTLIDLPGISRIAIEDQPADVCDQIRKIIMDYVKSENTVILCVISGDLDIAVNESINIARQVDEGGLRTIGVITKPDIADTDHKIEIIKMMDNLKIKLKKGFNLVKCRSSEQLKNKISLSEFLENEMEFYENDDIFKRAKKSQLGAVNLSRKITIELVNVIKMTLPKLRLEIETLLEESKSKLADLPQSVPTDNKDKRSYMMNIATDLNEKMRSFLCDGETTGVSNFHQFWRIEFKTFESALSKKRKNAFENQFSIASLRHSIQEFRGKEMSGFLSFSLFERLLKPYIQSYKTNAMDVITKIGKLIKSKLEFLFEGAFSYLPYVEKDMKRILQKEFENTVKATEEKIDFIFRQENIIFTMDTVFVKTWKRMEKNIKEKPHKYRITASKTSTTGYKTSSTSSIFDSVTNSESITSPEQMLMQIKCYLKIVHTRLIDNIPTAIMECLLNQLQDALRSRIFEYMSSDEIIEKIKETSQVLEDRQNLMDKIKRLKRGKEELQSL